MPMRLLSVVLLLASFHAGDVLADDPVASVPETEIAPDTGKAANPASEHELGSFCFFQSTPAPPSNYQVIRKLKLGKGTYGSVLDILPKFAEKAKDLGADAIIRYTGSQRFGFWPWRAVRPVVTGVAIKWTDNVSHDCAALGGKTLDAIKATNQPPGVERVPATE